MKNNTSILSKSANYIGLFFLVAISTFKIYASPLSITNVSANKSKYFFETNRVWINVTGAQGAFSQTLMGYRTGATDGIDHGLDGAYMNDGAIALASLIGNVRYAIQFKGLPFTSADVVPLSFSASYSGTYTFAIDHLDGFFTNSSLGIYIHDTVTNTYNNLKTSGYTFTSEAGMYNSRFELTYTTGSTALGIGQNTFNAENLNLSQNNDNIIIDSGTTLLKDITLYSINGTLLYQNHDINSSQTTISSLILSQQPIIIKVTTEGGITVTKKWLYL
ncbi:T9SS sorting signal type C domain-containing protein [Flavobacterium sangjuense]|uniref:Uncharacterized protein n=1 Tax=Flavobacterium sangjuense TaxID=2518177 RepID=A0A4P7PPP0_9FLAO|nr:T9SS sorting signal type C domain-containing protein [Flavobacterium sangjuense]QBZ96591.1 hypothetical protein GS03_00064 [Flavobacterium sangjuense]